MPNVSTHAPRAGRDCQIMHNYKLSIDFHSILKEHCTYTPLSRRLIIHVESRNGASLPESSQRCRFAQPIGLLYA